MRPSCETQIVAALVAAKQFVPLRDCGEFASGHSSGHGARGLNNIFTSDLDSHGRQYSGFSIDSQFGAVRSTGDAANRHSQQSNYWPRSSALRMASITSGSLASEAFLKTDNMRVTS